MAITLLICTSTNKFTKQYYHEILHSVKIERTLIKIGYGSLKSFSIKIFIQSMPDQLETKVGQNGTRLSGGQRQRLAIARAFYQEAKFLVLDEATSSLDNKAESELMNAVDLIGKDCTVVIIAHRLSTIMNADCIYEFEKGKIKASVAFDELKTSSDSFNMSLLRKRF